MNKRLLILSVLICLLSLSACDAVGDKSANVSFVYLFTFAASCFLLLACCLTKNSKDTWVIVLFSSVTVVNGGYALLAFSKTLETALWANRVAYLGSVFLPIAMIMIFLNITETAYGKYLPFALCALAIGVFAIAASPGYSDIYYKEVSLKFIDGAAVLDKVYGDWHSIYLYYLIIAFASMIVIIIRALAVKRLKSPIHAAFMFIAVFVNICVWLLEQLFHIEFEILSVSYIITELFLLAVSFMVYEIKQQENVKTAEASDESKAPEAPFLTEVTSEQIAAFTKGLDSLTKTERTIFTMHTAGESTKSIMNTLNIKENTLKYHNKNIYGKLGVKSKKQLLLIHKHINEN